MFTLDFRIAKQQRHPLSLPKGLIQVPKTKHTKSLVTAVNPLTESQNGTGWKGPLWVT